MKINWFPGHMHKARLQIEETLPRVDVVVEVLDARIPYSSENPMLAELRGDKPCVKVLAKSDLADPERTAEWQSFLESSKGISVRAVTTSEIPTIRRLKSAIVNAAPGSRSRTVTTLVAGIPNVGKSTIINVLAGKKVARTGNEPAVTKGQQRINIGDGIFLLDTPGVMWPNVENVNSGYRLATIGSIKETAMDYADTGFFAARFLLEQYPDRVMERYQLEELPPDNAALIDAIGRKRGCLGRSGVVDIDRASKILVTELRSGQLGRLTLETPEMMKREIVETQKQIAEAAARKKLKDEKRKKRFRAKQRAKKKGQERQHWRDGRPRSS